MHVVRHYDGGVQPESFSIIVQTVLQDVDYSCRRLRIRHVVLSGSGVTFDGIRTFVREVCVATCTGRVARTLLSEAFEFGFVW